MNYKQSCLGHGRFSHITAFAFNSRDFIVTMHVVAVIRTSEQESYCQWNKTLFIVSSLVLLLLTVLLKPDL